MLVDGENATIYGGKLICFSTFHSNYEYTRDTVLELGGNFRPTEQNSRLGIFLDWVASPGPRSPNAFVEQFSVSGIFNSLNANTKAGIKILYPPFTFPVYSR